METLTKVRHVLSELGIGEIYFVLGQVMVEKRHPLDIVLFCGSPGAGKSTFYWKHLKHLGYERVNQDILKTVCGLCHTFLAR